MATIDGLPEVFKVTVMPVNPEGLIADNRFHGHSAMTRDKHQTDIEDIDCTQAIGQLYACLDDEIDDVGSLQKLEHHLEHCHSCFTRTEVEGALTGRIQKAAGSRAPESLQSRLRDLIDTF